MDLAAWITTPDATALLAPLAVFVRPSGPSAAARESTASAAVRAESAAASADSVQIILDEARGRQTFLGCGASLTESSASLLARLPVIEREAALTQLFSVRMGIGLSVLRQPIGSSAFVAGTRYYTYDDMPSGQTDFRLEYFSIERDEAQILPLLRRALSINPELRVIGTPWSAPAWMKTNGSLVGGELIDSPRYYEAYAGYLAAFLRAYEAAGVPIYALTLQNEPQNRNPDVPGMHLGVEQARRLIHALGPVLRDRGLDTRILAYDHNWAMHPDDLAAAPPDSATEADYPFALLADPETAPWVAGTAFHCYFGDASAQSALHERFPDKDIYFTECSGSRGSADSDAKAFSDTLRWHARNVVIGATRNWARTVVTWNLALDPSGGPHANGYTDFSGLVTVEDDGRITPNAEYYALAHLSRFVRPGALCVHSDAVGEGSEDVAAVAFRNPDGGSVVLVHNESERERSIDVCRRASQDAGGDGTTTATVALPPGALVTVVMQSAAY
ncbi:MAG TPA: glycoside hydrolase family 30 beta sandwich domain-containing protein [Actinospica sp.]|nr:glycoside hydrolase family 30 beta sandwich domain-containing protein [Actinospica sp.]